MNYVVEEKPDPALVATRRQTNDAFRRSLSGGNIILTAGILALGAGAQVRILDAVHNFDDFDWSDPWDDHSIGDFEITVTSGTEKRVTLIFFKVTSCVSDGKGTLTLSLADEWWGCRDAYCPSIKEAER